MCFVIVSATIIACNWTYAACSHQMLLWTLFDGAKNAQDFPLIKNICFHNALSLCWRCLMLILSLCLFNPSSTPWKYLRRRFPLPGLWPVSMTETHTHKHTHLCRVTQQYMLHCNLRHDNNIGSVSKPSELST